MQHNLPAAAVTAASAYKISKEDMPKLMDEAVRLHNMAVEGDTKAVSAASDILKRLYTNYPGDKRIQAYLGSITTLKGRDLINPIDRMKYALRGLKMLDQAAAGDSKNNEIRLIRANVCLRLPDEYFHRMDTAIEDFKYLLDMYYKDNNTLSGEMHLDLLFKLGCAYLSMNRIEDAKAAWNRIQTDAGADKYKEYMAKLDSELPSGTVAEKVSITKENSTNQEKIEQQHKTEQQHKAEHKEEAEAEPKKKAWRRL